uniref:LPS responsive beige-like anchor protein n=1 Tax=Latimeria chalumnae TaxID=7897 RepID=H3AS19_LATCH
LVGGEFDLETNFVIQEGESIVCMVELLDKCDVTCQAEVLSIFTAVLKKSIRNLQACTDVGLITLVLNRIDKTDHMIADLLVDMLGVLASYSITVRELKLFFSKLQGEKGQWTKPVSGTSYLSIFKYITFCWVLQTFLNFTGKSKRSIILCDIVKSAFGGGGSAQNWLVFIPVDEVSIFLRKIFISCFKRFHSGAIDYGTWFRGGCLLVTCIACAGKVFEVRETRNFNYLMWYMVTLVHIYNRWKNSEIRCYVNGELASFGELAWLVNTSDTFDKCFLGSSETVDANRMFCGQMGAVYLFSEALNAAQIFAIYQLGSGYKGTFKFKVESDLLLAEHHKMLLYDGKLCSSIAFTYNPRATDAQLCLESSPKDNPSIFVHSPHALMLQDVRAVTTHSIQSAIHSIGGIQVLFPLFAQLDYRQHSSDLVDTTVCSTLLAFVMELLKNSVAMQEQILSCKGFLVIGNILNKSSKAHITRAVLELCLAFAKYLSNLQNGVPLLKQLCDHVLLNPAVWIHAPAKVQLHLYTYLSTEFVSTVTIYNAIRRVGTVLQIMHTLKYYYWVVNPQDRSGVIPKGLDSSRPNQKEILSLRAFLLLFVKQLVMKDHGVKEDELQSILNYLLTIHEDDNLMDVLQLLVALMAEHPGSMIPAFDQRNGMRIVYKLLASKSEGIRVQALKVMGYFLKHLVPKRKAEIMLGHGLFSLLSERLMLQTNVFTMTTYNVLFEILIEQISTQVVHKQHPDPDSSLKILNPQILKVIAMLLRNSPQTPETTEVRRVFLSDMIKLFNNSRENRRSLLQCSVWQEWMLSLCFVSPKNSEEQKITEMVYAIFRILLYHAVRYEWGGWRVWVDTLSITHSKVTFEMHKENLARMFREYQRQESENIGQGPMSPLRTISGVSSGDEATLRNEISEIADPADAVRQQSVEDAAQKPEGDQRTSVTTTEVEKTEKETCQSPTELKFEKETTDLADPEVTSEAKTLEEVKICENHEESSESPSVRSLAEVAKTFLEEVTAEACEKLEREMSRKWHEIQEEEKPLENGEPGSSASEGQETPASAEVTSKDKSSDTLTSESKDVESPSDAVTSDPALGSGEGATGVKPEDAKPVDEAKNESKEELIIQAGKAEAAACNDVDKNTVQSSTKPKQMKIAKLDVSSVASDTEKLELKANLSPESAQAQPSSPEMAHLQQPTLQRHVSDSNERKKDSPTATRSATMFRIPEFKWSHMHQRLLTDLLFSIETDVQMWRSSHSTKTVMDFVNSSENVIFVHNTIHLISQVVDNITMSCGGILPLLSAATSATHELENIEPTQGLSIDASVTFLQRLISLVDVLIFASSLGFSEIEAERNMASGGILRQCLRLVCAVAVRNCLECQQYTCKKSAIENIKGQKAMQSLLGTGKSSAAKSPVDIVTGGLSPIRDLDRLLQDMDINRLRAVVFRDVDDSKQAQFLALAVVYFISVLMVSKYRDILEPQNERRPPQRSQSLKNTEAPTPNPNFIDCEHLPGLESTTSTLAAHTEELESTSLFARRRDSGIGEEPVSVLAGDSIVVSTASPETVSAGPDAISEVLSTLSSEVKKNQESRYDGDSESKPAASAPTGNQGKNVNVKDILKSLVSTPVEATVVDPALIPPVFLGAKGEAPTEQPIQFRSFDRSVVVAPKKTLGVASGSMTVISPTDAVSVVASSDTNQDSTADPAVGSGNLSANLPSVPAVASVPEGSVANMSITERLEHALEKAAPLLREIFVDFAPFLSRTLLGSHGQELLIEGTSLVCMKSTSSVVELVMLLCSQEWQNSIQKNAGLAFIELVNEGRLLSQTLNDHLVRVANEAEFILSRQRAEDIHRHAEFESLCAQYSAEKREEEKMCDHLIRAAKYRDHVTGTQLIQKIINILTDKHGAWGSSAQSRPREFWRLDYWEDDLRRRQRFVRNPLGSTHPEATLKAAVEHVPEEDVLVKGKQSIKGQVLGNQNSESEIFLEGDDDTVSSLEEKDLENLTGPVSLCTPAYLVAPSLTVKGTLSITSSELYFEVDEEDPSFKKIDPKV